MSTNDKIVCSYGIGCLFTCMAILTMACNSSKKTQAQKDYEARQKQIAQLQEVRKQFPCDTLTQFVVIGTPKITSIINESANGDTVQILTTITQVDTLLKVIIDSALVHELRLDGMQKDHILELKEEQTTELADEISSLKAQLEAAKPYERGVKIALWSLAGIGLIGLIWRFKSPILSLIKKFI